jgi:hypothetical protein
MGSDVWPAKPERLAVGPFMRSATGPFSDFGSTEKKRLMKVRKKESPRKTTALVKPYEPTTREKGVLETFNNRRRSRKPAPRLNVVTTGEDGTVLKLDHAEQGVGSSLLMEATGTTDADFLDGLIRQLCSVGSHGRAADEDGLNFMLAVVKGIEPRDQVEAMLAAQMAATHNATMTFARRLNLVENIPQQDSAERAFNKLARTFASQVEALKRYRTRGEQTVRVEHVTVNEGGQAIIGNVSHGGGGGSEKTEPTP